MRIVFKYFVFSIVILACCAAKQQEFTLYSPDEQTPIDLVFSAPPNEMTLSISPDSKISFNTVDKEIINYDPETDTLSTIYDLKLGSDVELYGQPNDILFLDTEQWKLVYFEDFQGSALGWSEGSLSSCGTSSNLFLGGNCNFANQVITKKISDLPEHRMVRLKFNFHFFGNWKGESAFAKVNDDFVWAHSYNWCNKVLPWYCKKYGISVCGTDYPDILSHPVEYTGRHYASEIELSFSTNLPNDPCNASWGLDDVQIFII